MTRPLAILPVLVSLLAACGGDDDGHGAHTPVDAGTATDTSPLVDTGAVSDTGTVVDAGTTDDTGATNDSGAVDAGETVPMLNDCTATDYMDVSTGDDTARVVRPRGSTGYTPRCLIVRASQSVTFEMDFTVHPLVPGIPHGPTAGATSPNVIARQSSGATYTVAFPTAGYFPFYCNRHGHVGMAGVVRVMP